MTDVVVAIDIGGTGMKCALVDAADGTIRHTERHPTGAERGPEAVADTIVEVAAGLADTARLEGLEPRAVGLVAPGVIDETTGVAVWSANVGFRDVPLRDLVIARLELPAVLGHDVRGGALAEARLGAGRGRRAGVVRRHRHRHRRRVRASTAAPTAARTARPARSATSSSARTARGAAAACAAASRRSPRRHRSPGAMRERTGAKITAADVVARAADGDAAAIEVWADAIDALADGLLIGITLYDPDVIVLGGGLAEAGAALLDPLTSARARAPHVPDHAVLVRAELGDEAGCLGAALLAIDLLAVAEGARG